MHLGNLDSVGLVSAADVKLLVPAVVQGEVAAEVVYRGPLIAPMAKGTEVAELVIRIPGLPERRLPLVTEEEVEKAGFFRRFVTAAGTLYSRYYAGASDS